VRGSVKEGDGQSPRQASQLPGARAEHMVRPSMTIGTSQGRTAVLAAIVASAGLVYGCEMASLGDEGPVHPVRLVFSIQPENSTAGTPLPVVAVTVMESNGDTALSSTATIQLAIANGSGRAGAHLGGVTQAVAVNGTALFPSVTIDSAGTGYQLAAFATGLASAASNAFDVSAGAAVRLAFVRQPTSTAAGDTIKPAVAVAVVDALGNRVLVAADSVTLALAAAAGSASLGGTAVRRADSGLAVYPDLSVSTAGTGYLLVATARGFAPDTSAAFNVTAGVPPTPGVPPARSPIPRRQVARHLDSSR